jgi:hypothetical protein
VIILWFEFAIMFLILGLQHYIQADQSKRIQILGT